MQVRNNSARLHTVGETLIVPGTTVELGEEWRASLAGHAELEIVEEAPKRVRTRSADTEE